MTSVLQAEGHLTVSIEMQRNSTGQDFCLRWGRSTDVRAAEGSSKEIPQNYPQVLQQHLAARSTTLTPDLKKAIITPVLKPNKSAFETGSCRPIALTLVLCKLMERLIANRLRSWMEDNGLYSRFHSGFRKRRSCQDHIMRHADEIHKAPSTTSSSHCLS